MRDIFINLYFLIIDVSLLTNKIERCFEISIIRKESIRVRSQMFALKYLVDIYTYYIIASVIIFSFIHFVSIMIKRRDNKRSNINIHARSAS